MTYAPSGATREVATARTVLTSEPISITRTLESIGTRDPFGPDPEMCPLIVEGSALRNTSKATSLLMSTTSKWTGYPSEVTDTE